MSQCSTQAADGVKSESRVLRAKGQVKKWLGVERTNAVRAWLEPLHLAGSTSPFEIMAGIRKAWR